MRLGLLVDWPHYSTMALLFWQDHVTDLTPPVRPLARMVRVDEGVVEFRLLTSGERVVMAGGFFDGVPTAGQYELALRILVDYQELHPEPSWFPGFDRAALIQQHPERPKDDTTAR